MKFLAVDGHSLLYRSFYSPSEELTAPDGSPTKAIYLSLRSLTAIVRTVKPTHLVVAFDYKRDLLKRRELFPEYKANRKAKPPFGFIPQVKAFRKLLQRLGVARCRAPGFEADDLIACLHATFHRDSIHRGNTGDFVIASGDKDLLGMLNRERTHYYCLRENKFVFPEDVQRRFGVRVDQLYDYLVLVGDSSDNVPGVRGIGPKKAVTLLKQWGSLDRLLQNAGRVGGATGSALVGAIEGKEIELMQTLIYPYLGVTGLPSIASCRFFGFNFAAARGTFRRLGFRNFA